MSESQPHEMQLVRTDETGAEEWYCPICGRRFLMHWPPAYKKIVLEPGDEYAAHIGGRGAAQLRAGLSQAAFGALYQQTPSPEAPPVPDVAPLPHEPVGPVPLTPELRPWLRWMSSVGLAEWTDDSAR